MFEKNRKRRVICNDDADQHMISYDGYGYDYHITDRQSFLNARTTPTFNTQVDTYVWCVGNGCETPYGCMGKLHPCLESHGQATHWVIEACHQQGLEVWGSLRMNDLHDSVMVDCLEKTHDPLKARHPEYLIRPPTSRQLPEELFERYLWTAFNFACPEVRQYRLDFIQRNASRHDFDGYELDFTRFVWYFPPGQEETMAPHMTDLVRQARGILNMIGQKRGRPYTFVVHVHDSLDVSLRAGLDVETWLKEGLVDVLVVGMGYMPYILPLDRWQELGEHYGVPIYPSINANIFHPWWKELFKNLSIWQEAIRAGSAHYWQQQVDGIYLFNLFCLPEQHPGPMPDDFMYQPLKEIGGPATLAGKNKIYAIQPTSDGGFCHPGSDPAPLPIALDSCERKLDLQAGPDAGDPKAKFTLHVLTSGVGENTRVWLRLNHHLLEKSIRENNWYRVAVPTGVLSQGHNELSIWSNEAITQTQRPVIILRVFLRVEYPAGGA